MTAEEASAVILAGVKAGKWRILVGEDAEVLDEMVRAEPENAYTVDFNDRFQARVAWALGSLQAD